MPPTIGATFAPTFENSELATRDRATTRASSPLKVLNYSMEPRVAGSPGGLSPLQGQRFAGSPIGQAVLESVLRAVLGADASMFLNSGGQANTSRGPEGWGGQSRDTGMQDLQGAFQGLVGGGEDIRSPRAPVIHPGGDEWGRGPSPDGGGSGNDDGGYGRVDLGGDRSGGGTVTDTQPNENGGGFRVPDFSSILRR